jgi:hypothetical protein
MRAISETTHEICTWKHALPTNHLMHVSSLSISFFICVVSTNIWCTNSQIGHTTCIYNSSVKFTRVVSICLVNLTASIKMDLEYQSLHRLWKILNSYIGNLKDKINKEIRVNILVWCVSTYMIYMVIYIYIYILITFTVTSDKDWPHIDNIK